MVSPMLAGFTILLGYSMVINAAPASQAFIIACQTDDSQFFPPSNRAHDTAPIYDWPQGKIPYRFEADLGAVTSNDREVFRQAMNQIEAETCFKFIEDQTPPDHYLKIVVDESKSCNPWSATCPVGCGSFSGVVNTETGNPVVTLTVDNQVADHSQCIEHQQGGILHELMHALGVMHTHKRSDRDKYIIINDKNIQPGQISQYSPPCDDCVNHGIPYDCKSIMHYGTETWWNERGPTMTSKVAGCNLTDQGSNVAQTNDWNMLREVSKGQCSGSGTISTSGQIMSTNFPNNYMNDEDKPFPLKVKDGFKIELTFTDFDIEDHPKCDYDYVEVLDSDNNRMIKKCGNSVPGPITSKGNTMTVKFKSDSFVTRKGFKATWKQVEATESGST